MSTDEPNPTGRGELEPTNAILEARNPENNLVLRCTTPRGEHVDFISIDLDGAQGLDGQLWVQMHESEMKGHTTPQTGVENFATHCVPDVELIAERRSLFAEARADD